MKTRNRSATNAQHSKTNTSPECASIFEKFAELNTVFLGGRLPSKYSSGLDGNIPSE